VDGRWTEEAGGNGYGPPLLAFGPRGKIEPFVEGMHLTVEGGTHGRIDRELWAPLDPHTTTQSRRCASCHDPAQVDEVYPAKGETTRSGARLLSPEERAKVARVGRCQACHEKYEDPIWNDFAESRARRQRARSGAGRADPKARRCRGASE
jgi:hypothetical protein